MAVTVKLGTELKYLDVVLILCL